MRKKTTSQIICENFKIPSQIIFQDYKCTYRSSLTFFGRIYIGQQHFLFIANMFGIVKKCTINISNITKINEDSIAGTINICENHDGHQLQYTFASFKNNNAYKLMRALWKGQKIASEVLKAQNQQQVQVPGMEDIKNQDKHLLDEGNVQAKVFNYRNVESEKQKMFEVILPCSVEQYYEFFLADTAVVYSRKKHLQKRGSNQIVVTDWKRNNELNSDVREVTCSIKVTGVPFLNYAGMSQVFMLKKDDQKNEIILDIVTEMSDVPYCTYFNVEEHITIVSQGEKKCKMTTFSSVVFNKSTYMKNTIVTKTFADFKDEYDLWVKNVKQVLQQLKKRRQSTAEKSKKVQVQYQQNLPVTDKTLTIDVIKQQKQKPLETQKSQNLQYKVDLLIKMVSLLLLINFVQIIYKIIY